MKYRKKPECIDAFKMTKEAFENRALPAWVAQLKPAITSDGFFQVWRGEWHLVVPHGWWLIRDKQGRLRTAAPHEFEREYEPACTLNRPRI